MSDHPTSAGPSSDSDSDGPRKVPFAVKLDHLFRTITNKGAEYTYQEVSEGCTQNGTPISHTYVWQLRRGKKTNPSLRHIEALAEFFSVPPTYFLDDDAHELITAQLELLGAIRSRDIQDIALRAVGLSTPSLRAIAGMITSARSMEGLPELPERQDDEPDS